MARDFTTSRRQFKGDIFNTFRMCLLTYSRGHVNDYHYQYLL